jgi:3-hydroxybutyryl-CoA dehydrogenase
MGVHFMNPVPVMQLVELIKGLQTSEATYSTIRSFVEKIGKTAVLGIDSPGFIVNRILCPMINEAIFLLQEGVKPEDIDNAMKLGTNQPMGPLTLADFVGLDTLLFILQILHRELGEDKYRPCPLLIKYVEAGWYGRKSGRGFYDYSAK